MGNHQQYQYTNSGRKSKRIFNRHGHVQNLPILVKNYNQPISVLPIEFTVVARGIIQKCPGWRFKNIYELVNLRALKFLTLYANRIFQCIGLIQGSDAEIWCFLWSMPELSKQSRGWWFETPSRPLWRHRNDRCNFSGSSKVIRKDRLVSYHSKIQEITNLIVTAPFWHICLSCQYPTEHVSTHILSTHWSLGDVN